MDECAQVLKIYNWSLVPMSVHGDDMFEAKPHIKQPMKTFMVWAQAVHYKLAVQYPSPQQCRSQEDPQQALG